MTPTDRLALCTSVDMASVSIATETVSSDDAQSISSGTSDELLFGGISDELLQDLTALEDPLFGNISDEFFEDIPDDPTLSTIADIDMSEEEFFEDIPNAQFESMSEIGPSISPKPSLLTLPAEIRNTIYDLVFVSPSYIGANHHHRDEFFKEAAKWRNLAFAMACRQIYDESANIFYAKNGFVFFFIGSFLEFMESIGYQRRRLLTRLSFNFDHGSPFVALRYIRSCESLLDLNVSVRVSAESALCGSWWLYPVKNVHALFFTDFNVIEFGEGHIFGDAIGNKAGQLFEVAPKAMVALREALIKVKEENALRPFG